MIRRGKILGFSIVEILIAVVIIGILAAILVPALANRARQARLTSAKADLEAIAEAEERLAIDLGFYVRLYVLDDLPGGNQLALDQNPPFDGIEDEALNDNFFDNPEEFLIDITTGDLLAQASQVAILDQIVEGTKVWNGPYYNIHSDETNAVFKTGAFPSHLHDIPNDPWGNDYVLITRVGLLDEPSGVIDTNFESLYDRPTVLSLGPNGVFNSGQGDDIFRSFGF